MINPASFVAALLPGTPRYVAAGFGPSLAGNGSTASPQRCHEDWRTVSNRGWWRTDLAIQYLSMHLPFPSGDMMCLVVVGSLLSMFW